MGSGQDSHGTIPSGGKRCFTTPRHPDHLWAYLVSSPMGTRGSFPGCKVAGSETDHLPLPSAEVKSGGAVPQLPNVFMA
jgi:hypothetical protein